jgi:tetratricopeptide (TPR) repeat protein
MPIKLNPFHFLLPLAIALPSCLIPSLSLAQTPPVSPNLDPNRIAAEKAEAEAQKLGQEDAPLATQVIPKWIEALKYWQLADDHKKEVSTLDRIAKFYILRGEYPKALEYAQKLLPICEALNDRECQGAAFSSLSIIYDQIGQYQKAIDYYQQIPSLFPDTPKLTPITLRSIGQTYSQNLGQNQKGLDYYNQALSFWRAKGDVVKQAEIFDYIAFFYLNLGESQKAIESLKQANALDPEFKRDIPRTVIICVF